MKKMIVPTRRPIAILTALVIVPVVGILCIVRSRGFSEVPVLDPDQIAAAETRMWQAYYARDLLRLHSEMADLLRVQFQIPPADEQSGTSLLPQ
jgi:hypothetical protein